MHVTDKSLEQNLSFAKLISYLRKKSYQNRSSHRRKGKTNGLEARGEQRGRFLTRGSKPFVFPFLVALVKFEEGGGRGEEDRRKNDSIDREEESSGRRRGVVIAARKLI